MLLEYSFPQQRKTKIMLTNFNNDVLELKDRDTFIVCDRNVLNKWPKISKICKNNTSYIFNASESNKNFKIVLEIISLLNQLNFTRNSTIIAIGGGITTDIAAFIASIFKRGIKLVLVPTTYIAMIDAAIGGKTGINYKGLKNNIGTFYPADRIVIDCGFLNTLPQEEILNGWSEAIKAFLLNNQLSFEKSEINPELIEYLIQIKMSFCLKDLEDKDKRKYLNLGHTFAHMVESLSDYEISHGEAVAYGLRVAIHISYNLGLITKARKNNMFNLVDTFNLPDKIPGKIYKRIKKYGQKIVLNDKKADNGVKYILFEGNTDFVLSSIDNFEVILDAFKKITR